MNYCIKCSKVLINRINFTEARVAQMDSNKYIYFCDDCGKYVWTDDSNFCLGGSCASTICRKCAKEKTDEDLECIKP